ncbi:tetratricopeptide repeat protein [Uliginosibacterium aquaticum]|uniref:MxaK protein n=1 Tax=Uliginosibacterium aquaticum TaxID=2731212 RepID=A0ABX2ICH2_9RHOO|nr:hypothetical protein [Uliginosibacterium aquaticum]NSL54048.1 hypothetical protein [Uliginosibacterium aquaticum]
MLLERSKLGNWLLICLILLAAGWGMWQGQRLMRGDFSAIQARYRIDTWVAGSAKWTVPEWMQARDDLLAAAEIMPDNPLTFDYLGILNTLRGQRGWNEPSLRKGYFGEAMGYQQTSLRLRPQNGAAWSNLALSFYALGDHAGAAASLEQALKYGPYELGVKKLSSDLVLAMWPDMPPSLQQWLLALYRTSPPWERQVLEKLAKSYGYPDVLK